MIRTYLSELIVLLLVLWLVGWGAVKLWFTVKKESSRDREELRAVRRDAEVAVEELREEVKRRKRRHPGPRQ
jgi:hypothetical protein